MSLTLIVCPVCSGVGALGRKQCPTCRGVGKIMWEDDPDEVGNHVTDNASDNNSITDDEIVPWGSRPGDLDFLNFKT